MVLASVSLFVLGIWCNVFATPLYRTTSASALAGPSPFGSPSFCFKSSLSEFEFLFTFSKTRNLSGSGNPGAVGESFVLSPIDSLRIQPDPLSGRDRLSFPKVSLQILNSVFIL